MSSGNNPGFAPPCLVWTGCDLGARRIAPTASQGSPVVRLYLASSRRVDNKFDMDQSSHLGVMKLMIISDPCLIIVSVSIAVAVVDYHSPDPVPQVDYVLWPSCQHRPAPTRWSIWSHPITQACCRVKQSLQLTYKYVLARNGLHPTSHLSLFSLTF